MAVAKLSHSAAASLSFVKKLQSDETHKMVRKEVFSAVKAQFGIPDKHRIKVELDQTEPDYLVIKRKSDGAAYELDTHGKWVEATPAQGAAQADVYVELDEQAMQEIAATEVNDNGAEVKSMTEIGSTEKMVLKSGHLYVRIPRDEVEDQDDIPF